MEEFKELRVNDIGGKIDTIETFGGDGRGGIMGG